MLLSKKKARPRSSEDGELIVSAVLCDAWPKDKTGAPLLLDDVVEYRGDLYEVVGLSRRRKAVIRKLDACDGSKWASSRALTVVKRNGVSVC